MNPQKFYIQNSKKIEDRQEEFYRNPQRSLDYLIPKKETKPLKKVIELKKEALQSFKEIRILKSIELIEPNQEIELEIEEAFLHLEKMRNEEENIEISEDIWYYSQDILRTISNRYWNKYGIKLSKSRFNFIDDSIEIRWEKDDFKLILSIADDINDIVIYMKTKSGRYMNGTVSKKEIVNWVLDQFQNY